MFYMPPAAEPLVARMSIASSRPTFNRFVLWMVAAVLTFRGRATRGHPHAPERAVAHRRAREGLPPRAELSPPVAVDAGGLGRVLARAVLMHVLEDEPVTVATPGGGRPRHAAPRGQGVRHPRMNDAPRRGPQLAQPQGVAVGAQVGGAHPPEVCVKFPFASRATSGGGRGRCCARSTAMRSRTRRRAGGTRPRSNWRGG